MRIVSQPAKRLNGWPKELLDRPLSSEDISIDGDGVKLSLIVKDIYSKGSNQRYTVSLNARDLAVMLEGGEVSLLHAAE